VTTREEPSGNRRPRRNRVCVKPTRGFAPRSPSLRGNRGVCHWLRSVALSAQDKPISAVSLPYVLRLVQGGVLPSCCQARERNAPLAASHAEGGPRLRSAVFGTYLGTTPIRWGTFGPGELRLAIRPERASAHRAAVEFQGSASSAWQGAYFDATLGVLRRC
jgi:hypothetical protein